MVFELSLRAEEQRPRPTEPTSTQPRKRDKSRRNRKRVSNNSVPIASQTQGVTYSPSMPLPRDFGDAGEILLDTTTDLDVLTTLFQCSCLMAAKSDVKASQWQTAEWKRLKGT